MLLIIRIIIEENSMDRALMTRQPSHPGKILHALYMEPLGLTITDLASRLGISRNTLSSLIHGRTSMSMDMAMRLSKAFNTSPETWLNMQRNLDIWKLVHQDKRPWEHVQPIREEDLGERVSTA